MDVERERCMLDIRTHERQIAELSRELDRLGPAQKRQDAIFLRAQLTKHRITVALLCSRLGELDAAVLPAAH